MKAIVWTQYGPPEVLQFREVAKPTPKPNEILIKIHATTVSAGDCEARSLKFPFWVAFPLRLYVGFSKPTRVTILGQEFAGEVEAVGQDVTLFKPSDQVFGTTGLNFGAQAEYICLPEKSEGGFLALKPVNMSYEEAAAAPTGGLEALHFLKAAHIEHGESVLVNGAGGSIGTLAVQIAKHFGAEVTAVDSAEKLDMLRSLGADHVIDYTQEDFTRQTYDVIFDVVGTNAFASNIRALKPTGRYLLANPRLSSLFQAFWRSRTTNQTIINTFSTRDPDDLLELKALIEAGKLKTIVDRTYPLAQTADAHCYVETGQKQGSVVITVVP